MNKVVLIGRLTREPDKKEKVTRFTLAVDRRFKKDGEPDADFISCAVFGKTKEFVDKYFKQGMKMALDGRIQTGSYTDQNGQKVYTTDVIGESIEFCEKAEKKEEPKTDANGFADAGYSPF